MRHFILGIIFLLPNFAIAQTDNSDFQLWNETSVDFPISREKSITGKVFGNLRATEDASELTDKRIGFGVKFKVSKNVSIAPSYLFRVQTGSDTTRYEHRFRFDVTPSKTFKNVKLENRSRFEHDFKTAGRTDNTFYRNRTKLSFPIKRSGRAKVTPFVSNGTFFDLKNPSVYRNETIGGVGHSITSNFGLEYFYMYRHNFESSTKHVNVVGVNVKFKIN